MIDLPAILDDVSSHEDSPYTEGGVAAYIKASHGICKHCRALVAEVQRQRDVDLALGVVTGTLQETLAEVERLRAAMQETIDAYVKDGTIGTHILRKALEGKPC